MYNPRLHHRLYTAVNASQVNARHNSTSVSELFRNHPTTDETAWRETFDKYSSRTLQECKDFAYQFTSNHPSFKDLPEKDVHGFVDSLFIEWTMRGFRVEKAIEKLIKDGSKFDVRQATTEEDHEFSIDLVLMYNGEDIGAVQVKPISYLENVKQGKHVWQYEQDMRKNKAYGKPVYWVYYQLNSDRKSFKIRNRDQFNQNVGITNKDGNSK